MAPIAKNTMSDHRASPGYLATDAGRTCEKRLDATPPAMDATNASRYHVRVPNRASRSDAIAFGLTAELTRAEPLSQELAQDATRRRLKRLVRLSGAPEG